MILNNLKKYTTLHILSGLGVFKNVKGTSINAPIYKIDKTIMVDDKKKDVFATEAKIGESLLRIIYSDISCEDNSSDFVFVISFANAPYYGFYLYQNFDDLNDFDSSDCLILEYFKDCLNECKVSVFSSVLSGLEQLKDLPVNWNQCKEYQDIYDVLIKVIDYHEGLLE